MYNTTSDEPFFELGKKLGEGNTFAFRGRARNGAGYGKNSEIWIVEVVPKNCICRIK